MCVCVCAVRVMTCCFQVEDINSRLSGREVQWSNWNDGWIAFTLPPVIYRFILQPDYYMSTMLLPCICYQEEMEAIIYLINFPLALSILRFSSL